MKLWAMLRRRNLMATMAGGGIAWVSGRLPRQGAAPGLGHSACGSAALAALCADLREANATGRACLQALPPRETNQPALARAILSDLPASSAAFSSTAALAQAIRDRSRHDFGHGRIVSVDGWMFSLTETRLYALATLLSGPPKTAG